MGLFERAVETIDLVEKTMDPLLHEAGFEYKRRRSDPSIFTETLKYEMENIDLEIIACWHPHDYPNILSVYFRNRESTNFPRPISFQDVLSAHDQTKSFNQTNLGIATEKDMENTLKRLSEGMIIIMKNKLYRTGTN